jgi:hypothetical protein
MLMAALSGYPNDVVIKKFKSITGEHAMQKTI